MYHGYDSKDAIDLKNRDVFRSRSYGRECWDSIVSNDILLWLSCRDLLGAFSTGKYKIHGGSFDRFTAVVDEDQPSDRILCLAL